MSNGVFQAATVLAVVVEAAAAAWALARRDLTAIVALNGFAAAAVLLYNAPDLALIVDAFDRGALLLVAFETITLVGSVLWFTWRAPSWLVWAPFSVHVFLSLALLIFAFTFRLDRLM
jgi:hypothetical protein